VGSLNWLWPTAEDSGNQVPGLPAHIPTTLPANVTQLHGERINLLLLLVSPDVDKTETLAFVFLAFRDIIY